MRSPAPNFEFSRESGLGISEALAIPSETEALSWNILTSWAIDKASDTVVWHQLVATCAEVGRRGVSFRIACRGTPPKKRFSPFAAQMRGVLGLSPASWALQRSWCFHPVVQWRVGAVVFQHRVCAMLKPWVYQ